MGYHNLNAQEESNSSMSIIDLEEDEEEEIFQDDEDDDEEEDDDVNKEDKETKYKSKQHLSPLKNNCTQSQLLKVKKGIIQLRQTKQINYKDLVNNKYQNKADSKISSQKGKESINGKGKQILNDIGDKLSCKKAKDSIISKGKFPQLFSIDELKLSCQKGKDSITTKEKQLSSHNVSDTKQSSDKGKDSITTKVKHPWLFSLDEQLSSDKGKDSISAQGRQLQLENIEEAKLSCGKGKDSITSKGKLVQSLNKGEGKQSSDKGKDSLSSKGKLLQLHNDNGGGSSKLFCDKEKESIINKGKDQISNKEKLQSLHEEIIIEESLFPSSIEMKKSLDKYNLIKDSRIQQDTNQNEVISELKKQVEKMSVDFKVKEKDVQIFKIFKEQDEIIKKNLKVEIEDLKKQNDKLIQKNEMMKLEARNQPKRDIQNRKFDSNTLQFTELLMEYNQDLKSIFQSISYNPNKYKKQNDELIIENTNMREQIIKLEEQINENRLEEMIRISREQQNQYSSTSDKTSSISLYETMVEKLSEMDERMVQNDNEKYEAIQQQDFWFSKAQKLEKQISLLKLQIKQQSENGSTFQLSKTSSKKLCKPPQQQLQQSPQKQEPQQQQGQQDKSSHQQNQQQKEEEDQTKQLLKKRKFEKENSDNEEESKLIDKKIKPNINDTKSQHNPLAIVPQSSPEKLEKQIVEETNSNIKENKVEAQAKPIENIIKPVTTTGGNRIGGFFTLRVCPTCLLTIKKAQPSEACSSCKTDMHAKCKNLNSKEPICKTCFEKQNKKNLSDSQKKLEAEESSF